MRIRRTTTTLLLGGALAIGLAAPAMAGPRGEYQDLQHTSCRVFGTGFASWAHTADPGAVGQYMSDHARGHGVATGVIHLEHFFGLGDGPLCDLKTD